MRAAIEAAVATEVSEAVAIADAGPWEPVEAELGTALPQDYKDFVRVYGSGYFMQFLGIYVASAAYIAVFMVWLGKYGWTRGIIVGVGVSAVTFAMFEIWFQVPLFKGEFNPLSLIGY